MEEDNKRKTGDNKSNQDTSGREKKEGGKKKLNYSAYYNDIIVREQPFYNSDKTYKGRYSPLGKQDWFK